MLKYQSSGNNLVCFFFCLCSGLSVVNDLVNHSTWMHFSPDHLSLNGWLKTSAGVVDLLFSTTGFFFFTNPFENLVLHAKLRFVSRVVEKKQKKKVKIVFEIFVWVNRVMYDNRYWDWLYIYTHARGWINWIENDSLSH